MVNLATFLKIYYIYKNGINISNYPILVKNMIPKNMHTPPGKFKLKMHYLSILMRISNDLSSFIAAETMGQAPCRA